MWEVETNFLFLLPIKAFTGKEEAILRKREIYGVISSDGSLRELRIGVKLRDIQ